MSKFNIGSIQNATINLSNGEELNVQKLDVEINGKKVAKGVPVKAHIEKGVLIISF